MDIITLRLENGKKVGRLVDGIAEIKVSSRHYFRQRHGYSVDDYVLSQVREHRGRIIRFINTETGEISTISLEAFEGHASPIDFGFGRKWIVHEKYYDQPGIDQLGLFDAGGGAHAIA